MDANNILFFDIETASRAKSYDDLTPTQKKLWDLKSAINFPNSNPRNTFINSGYTPDLGKITVASGLNDNGDIKSYTSKVNGTDAEAARGLSDMMRNSNKFVGGHNVAGFDIPYTAHRMRVNGVEIPDQFKQNKNKPWRNRFKDSMRATGGRNLGVAAAIFGVENPKANLQGTNTHKLYYEGKTDQLKKYNVGDVKQNKEIYKKGGC